MFPQPQQHRAALRAKVAAARKFNQFGAGFFRLGENRPRFRLLQAKINLIAVASGIRRTPVVECVAPTTATCGEFRVADERGLPCGIPLNLERVSQ